MSVLNLLAIEEALYKVQTVFADLNGGLYERRDPLDDEVIQNMLAGYALIDELITAGIDIFAMGGLSHWLQLNATVLCGRNRDQQRRDHRLLEATESRFYDEPEAGIKDVIEWHALNRNKSVWFRAAGVYNRILSEPQLFIEGNHRTGALILSYMLLRGGEPPFVLTERNAAAFFNPSSLIKRTKKRNLLEQFKFNRLTRAFADFLKDEKNDSFLASRSAGERGDSLSQP
jgi:hypothetical protein